MNGTLVAILRNPDFASRLGEFSFEALPGTAEEMGAAARREREKWKKVIDISGAKVD